MAIETPSEATVAAYNYDAFVRSSAVGMGAVFRGTVRVGEPAPEFALTALDGTTVRLADLRGKYVVLEFGSIT
jgi:cytochrome oxidase Cu insertion factor (SCO1/SenC/PrrC family)